MNGKGRQAKIFLIGAIVALIIGMAIGGAVGLLISGWLGWG